METQLRELLSSVAHYIQVAQPQLDKAASLRSSMGNYQEKLAYAIDRMVDKGLVPLQEKVALYNKLSGRPDKAADLLLHLTEKAASAGSYPALGGPSDRMDGAGVDPLLAFCLDS